MNETQSENSNLSAIVKEFLKGNLSPEQMNVLFSLPMEGIRKLMEVIKTEVDNSYKSHQDVIDFVRKQSEDLLSLIRDGNLSEDERKRIVEELLAMPDKIIELQKEDVKQRTERIKTFILGALAMIGMIFVPKILGKKNIER